MNDDTLSLDLRNLPRQRTQEDVDAATRAHDVDDFTPAERLASQGVG
jgi:hypothetical protein